MFSESRSISLIGEAPENPTADDQPVGRSGEQCMLHDVYGLDDRDIMRTLAAYDPKAGIDPTRASQQITEWMVKNCVTGKDNK